MNRSSKPTRAEVELARMEYELANHAYAQLPYSESRWALRCAQDRFNRLKDACGAGGIDA